MRWLPLAVLLAASPALADDVKPVRLSAKLDGTTARISARYALKVGAGWLRDHTRLDLPRDGLVTAARATLDATTHELELVGADDALAKFATLGAERVQPGAKTAAVMIAGGPEAVSISIATARAGMLYVDLEIAVPTCYVREVRYLAVPDTWGAIAGTARKHLASDEQLVEACGQPGERATRWIGFASRAVAKLPSGARIDVVGDRVDLGEEAIVRIELDLANVLAEIPRDLATVLVVDGSRSLDAREQQVQRDVVMAYLAGAPTSRVQLVSFARFATSLLPAWIRAKHGRAAIAAALTKLPAENGSNFDAGLAEAAGWLASIKGTRRIVLFTDERMATRLAKTPPAVLKQLLPPGTLVHVVVPTGRYGSLTRDDGDQLTTFAATTAGMRSIAGPAGGDVPLDVTSLLRPISLDLMTIDAPGWQQLPQADHQVACEADLSVARGAACTWWGRSTRAAAKPITIEGKLWGKAFTRVVTPSSSRAQDVARALSVHSGSPSELRDLVDTAAHAVNAKWSLYAAWGGPGTYEVPGGGTGFGATCDCGNYGTIGHGSGTGHGTMPGTNPQIDLRTQLADKLARCNLGDQRVAVEVELTLQEIADVHVKASTATGPEQARLERCVAEVVWSSAPVIAQPKAYQVMQFVAGG